MKDRGRLTSAAARPLECKEQNLNALFDSGIERIFHTMPLHYLPFLVVSNSLKSKVHLTDEGFGWSHFRSKSKHLDVQRGFGDYVHLSTADQPPILLAKLAAGFPHLVLSMRSTVMDEIEFDLCRYNIAMTRRLRRGGSVGFSASAANGRYFDDMQIPIARSYEQQMDLIASNPETMLEVLSKSMVSLPADTTVHVFSGSDRDKVLQVLQALGCDWSVQLVNAPHYTPKERYKQACSDFIENCLGNPDWIGDGLEFDKV